MLYLQERSDQVHEKQFRRNPWEQQSHRGLIYYANIWRYLVTKMIITLYRHPVRAYYLLYTYPTHLWSDDNIYVADANSKTPQTKFSFPETLIRDVFYWFHELSLMGSGVLYLSSSWPMATVVQFQPKVFEVHRNWKFNQRSCSVM